MSFKFSISSWNPVETVAVNVEPVNPLKVAADQRHLLSSGWQRHLVAIVGTSWTLGKVGPWAKLDMSESPYKSWMWRTGQQPFVFQLTHFIVKDKTEKWKQRSNLLPGSSSNWPSEDQSTSTPTTTSVSCSSRSWCTCCGTASLVTGIQSSRCEDRATGVCVSIKSQAPIRCFSKLPEEPASRLASWFYLWKWACGSIQVKLQPRSAKTDPSFRWLLMSSSGRTSARIPEPRLVPTKGISFRKDLRFSNLKSSDR